MELLEIVMRKRSEGFFRSERRFSERMPIVNHFVKHSRAASGRRIVCPLDFLDDILHFFCNVFRTKQGIGYLARQRVHRHIEPIVRDDAMIKCHLLICPSVKSATEQFYLT